MIIRNKEESLYYLEKLGLNYFTEKVFDPTDNMLLSKVEEFLDENNQNIYVLRDPTWNISTNYYDKKIKYIPNIDKIIDYIFKHDLFDTVVEFSVYLERVGKYQEHVVIFELRTNY